MPTYLFVHGERPVRIATPSAVVEGQLGVPERARGLVILAHATPTSAYAEGNRYVAAVLRSSRFATLVVNLLGACDSVQDTETSELRFRLPLLAARLAGVTAWAGMHPRLRELPVGYFAGGVSASAALESAAEHPELVCAMVARSGRPELAAASLRAIRTPVLLLAGEKDSVNVATNQRAMEHLPPSARLHVVPNAGPRLDDELSLGTVAQLAGAWFERSLPGAPSSDPVPLRVVAHH